MDIKFKINNYYSKNTNFSKNLEKNIELEDKNKFDFNENIFILPDNTFNKKIESRSSSLDYEKPKNNTKITNFNKYFKTTMNDLTKGKGLKGGCGCGGKFKF